MIDTERLIRAKELVSKFEDLKKQGMSIEKAGKALGVHWGNYYSAKQTIKRLNGDKKAPKKRRKRGKKTKAFVKLPHEIFPQHDKPVVVQQSQSLKPLLVFTVWTVDDFNRLRDLFN